MNKLYIGMDPSGRVGVYHDPSVFHKVLGAATNCSGRRVPYWQFPNSQRVWVANLQQNPAGDGSILGKPTVNVQQAPPRDYESNIGTIYHFKGVNNL